MGEGGIVAVFKIIGFQDTEEEALSFIETLDVPETDRIFIVEGAKLVQ